MSEQSNTDSIREKAKLYSQQQAKARKKKGVKFWGTTALVGTLALGSFGYFVVNDIQDRQQQVESSRSTDGISAEQWTPQYADSNGAFKLAKGGAVAQDSSPTDGVTRVDMWFDPLCPFCGIAERSISETVASYVDNNEIEMYYTPVSFLDQASKNTRYSTRAINALVTVAEKSPEHFGAYMKKLFDNQPHEGSAYVNVTNEQLAQWATEVGVPQDVADLIPKEHYNKWVTENSNKQMNRQDLFSDGFSTPALYINLQYDSEGKATGTKVNLNTSDAKNSFISIIEEAKQQ